MKIGCNITIGILLNPAYRIRIELSSTLPQSSGGTTCSKGFVAMEDSPLHHRLPSMPDGVGSLYRPEYVTHCTRMSLQRCLKRWHNRVTCSMVSSGTVGHRNMSKQSTFYCTTRTSLQQSSGTNTNTVTSMQQYFVGSVQDFELYDQQYNRNRLPSFPSGADCKPCR